MIGRIALFEHARTRTAWWSIIASLSATWCSRSFFDAASANHQSLSHARLGDVDAVKAERCWKAGDLSWRSHCARPPREAVLESFCRPIGGRRHPGFCRMSTLRNCSENRYCQRQCQCQSWIYTAQNHEACLLRWVCLNNSQIVLRFKQFPRKLSELSVG